MTAAALCLFLVTMADDDTTRPATQPTEMDRLVANLKAEEAPTRLAATRALAGHVEPRAVAALNEALKIETDPTVRFELVRTLVRLGDVEARALLRVYCLGTVWNISLAAAQALADAGDTEYLRLMVDVGLAHEDGEVRDSVLQALRFLEAPGTSELVRAAIRREPGAAEAAHLAAYLGWPDARQELLEALGRPSTAYGAARGLAVIAEPDLVADLRARLYRPESAAGAAHALTLIGGPTACAILFAAVEDTEHGPTSTQAVLAILRQSFGYGVAEAEQRWTLDRWQAWWRKNRDSVGGFENVTAPAGLLKVRGVGHRLSWGDYDGDGDDDLLIGGRYLWRNDGAAGFVDVTARAGIEREDVVGGVWADYNNDGRLDFFAACSNPARRSALWRNQGDGTFVDVAADAGQVSDRYATEAAAWGDYDNDGRVDLFVVNARPAGVDPEAGAMPDRLCRNNGDGTFTDVSRQSGLAAGPPRTGRGVAWGDFDNDGDLDCYVANFLYEPNALWMNRGDGTFADVAVAQRVSGRPHAFEGRELFGRSLGCAWGDYNNDGYLDLFCANIAPPDMLLYCDQSNLFRNRGAEPGAGGPPGRGPLAAPLGFRDVRAGAHITYERTHVECAWGDYDNDGDLDLALTSAFWKRRSYLYRNNGDGTFEDVTWVTGARVLDGWGCAWADVDGDGRLDLAAAGDYGVRLFRNVTKNANGWLQVDLAGTRSNRSAIGARITVTAGGRRQIREVSGGRGTGCQDSLVQHFGLGPTPGEATVEVRWPGGLVQQLERVKPNQRLRIVEPR